MPLFRVTVKRANNVNGVRVEPGMSVDVVTQSLSNPLLVNGGKQVAEAFMRIYGVDLKMAGVLNLSYLNVERIN